MSALSKLMQARLKLQQMELKKSGHNKFAGYHYFELGDFLPAVQKIFSELNLCGVVSYTAELARLTITDTKDSSAVEITSPMGSAALKGCHEVQNIGAVETYQRRYLWVTAMEIVEHDVLDATTGAEKTEKKEQQNTAIDRTTPLAKKLLDCGTASALQAVWEPLDKETKLAYAALKDECKQNIIKAQDAERAAA